MSCVVSREGLFSRPSQNDQAQVVIDVESGYDVDGEVEGLRGQVGKLKQVRLCLPEQAVPDSKPSSNVKLRVMTGFAT